MIIKEFHVKADEIRPADTIIYGTNSYVVEGNIADCRIEFACDVDTAKDVLGKYLKVTVEDDG